MEMPENVASELGERKKGDEGIRTSASKEMGGEKGRWGGSTRFQAIHPLRGKGRRIPETYEEDFQLTCKSIPPFVIAEAAGNITPALLKRMSRCLVFLFQ